MSIRKPDDLATSLIDYKILAILNEAIEYKSENKSSGKTMVFAC